MATHDAGSTDRGVGLTIAFGLLALGGTGVMYLNPNDPIAGWGFAFAILAASLAVVAAQVYW